MKNYTLLFLLCITFFSAQIPKSKDSLQVFLKNQIKDTTYIIALNEYAFLNVKEGDFDQANKNISQLDQLSKKLNFALGFYFTLNMKGVVEYSKQQPQKAMAYFLQSKDIIKKYNLPKKRYQNSLNNISIIYADMGDRENATKYAMELIEYQKINKLYPLKSSPYAQIGSNLKFYKKYEEALQYYNQELEIETGLKDFTGMAISENHLANVYEDLDKNKEAIKHLQKGYKYALKADYKLLQIDLLTNLGRLHQKEKNFEEAEKNLLNAKTMAESIEANVSQKIVYHNLGDLYMEKNQNSLAEEYYKKALSKAKELADAESSYSINEALSAFYLKTKDYKKAFEYKSAGEVFKDSIFKIETLENTEDMLRKYETKEKQQQIKTLSAANTIKNLKIKNNEKQKWFLISGLVFLGIIGGLLYYQSRNRKKTNTKLQVLNKELDKANKTKARFFSIINHDLRSPVATLIHFLHLKKDNPELMDEETRNRLENKSISNAENLLVSMEDLLLWSKSQMENFAPQFENVKISDLFFDNEKHFESEEGIEFIYENAENLNLQTDLNYLKTIIRNLTANSIKALEKVENPQIIWKVWQENTTLYLSIKDNGTSATETHFKALYEETEVTGIKSGLGLHLIRDLAKAINAKIKVNISEGNFTEIVIEF